MQQKPAMGGMREKRDRSPLGWAGLAWLRPGLDDVMGEWKQGQEECHKWQEAVAQTVVSKEEVVNMLYTCKYSIICLYMYVDDILF